MGSQSDVIIGDVTVVMNMPPRKAPGSGRAQAGPPEGTGPDVPVQQGPANVAAGDQAVGVQAGRIEGDAPRAADPEDAVDAGPLTPGAARVLARIRAL